MFVRCSEKMGVQKKVALVLLLFEAFSTCFWLLEVECMA